MGLDTSHDCWHGPYSQFMRWREWLHVYIQVDRGTPDNDGTDGYQKRCDGPELLWPYQNPDGDALDFLMCHSDCDGEIPASVCGALADALGALIEARMPARGTYDHMRPPTERFMAGLRRAAAAGEAVEFY